MSKAILTTESASNVAPLLSKPAEAAQALAISPRKLWELTNRGVVPAVRLDRAVRYHVADLEDFIGSLKKRAPRK